MFYGISVPLVKLLGGEDSASWTSALLYFGAGIAMIAVAAALQLRRKGNALGGKPLTVRQVPLLALMVALNAASAISLVAGISLSDASTASLLGNLEVAATAALTDTGDGSVCCGYSRQEVAENNTENRPLCSSACSYRTGGRAANSIRAFVARASLLPTKPCPAPSSTTSSAHAAPSEPAGRAW